MKRWAKKSHLIGFFLIKVLVFAGQTRPGECHVVSDLELNANIAYLENKQGCWNAPQSFSIHPICLWLTVALHNAKEGPRWDPLKWQNEVRQFLAGPSERPARITSKIAEKNTFLLLSFHCIAQFFLLFKMNILCIPKSIHPVVLTILWGRHQNDWSSPPGYKKSELFLQLMSF